MGLIDALSQVAGKKHPLEQWVDTLPEAERAAVLKAAVAEEWKHTALRALLIAEGNAPRMSVSGYKAWRVRQGWLG